MSAVSALASVVVGVCAFYWAAMNGIRILRLRGDAGPWAYVRAVSGLAVSAIAGSQGLGFLLARWREGRGPVASRLLLLALPLGCAYGIWYGIRGAMCGRIISRTGLLTGRQAKEHGILLALLAAIGLALTAPLLSQWPASPR